jgi:hypothetical protein
VACFGGITRKTERTENRGIPAVAARFLEEQEHRSRGAPPEESLEKNWRRKWDEDTQRKTAALGFFGRDGTDGGAAKRKGAQRKTAAARFGASYSENRNPRARKESRRRTSGAAEGKKTTEKPSARRECGPGLNARVKKPNENPPRTKIGPKSNP